MSESRFPDWLETLVFKIPSGIVDANRTIGQPNKLTLIFGRRITRHHSGKLQTVIEDLNLPNPVIRSHYRKGFLKQYVRDRFLLRTETATNNIYTDYAIAKTVENVELTSPATECDNVTCPAEGEITIRQPQAQARKLDHFILHNVLYALAFFGADSAEMEAQQESLAGLALASDTEAYVGHLHKARELIQRAVDFYTRSDIDIKEGAAIMHEIAALREAAFGNAMEAKHAAAEGLNLIPKSQVVEVQAALAFAMTGDGARAESLAEDLEKRFPLHTQLQSLWLPTIHAQLALNRKNSDVALNGLQAASPIELGQIRFLALISCLYPTYIRGEAYLAGGQGKPAAAEFQKVLDHSGIVWNCWTGALAHLGVARANALQGKSSQGADADAARVRALAAYQDFLTLWKDADPDIPILKQAKAEFVKMQQ